MPCRSPDAHRSAGTPVATTALSSRAPSRCVRSPLSRAAARTSSTRSSGQMRPPGSFVVCSTLTSRERGAYRFARIMDGRAHVVAGERAVVAVERADHPRRVRGRLSALVQHGMRRPVQDHLAARAVEVEAERDRVAHRPRGQEHRGLVAEQLRHLLAQCVDLRILEALLVTDLGGRHGGAHLRRRPRRGVGAQIDHGPPSRAFRGLSPSTPPSPTHRRTVRARRPRGFAVHVGLTSSTATCCSSAGTTALAGTPRFVDHAVVFARNAARLVEPRVGREFTDACGVRRRPRPSAA